VFLNLGGGSSNSAKDDTTPNPNPIVDLDALYGFPVPLFDLQENLIANKDAYTTKLSSVSDAANSTRTIIITFSVLAALFLILGIVSLVLHKLLGGKPERDALIEAHMEDNSVTQNS